jgi:hypothetical protein
MPFANLCWELRQVEIRLVAVRSQESLVMSGDCVAEEGDARWG